MQILGSSVKIKCSAYHVFRKNVAFWYFRKMLHSCFVDVFFLAGQVIVVVSEIAFRVSILVASAQEVLTFILVASRGKNNQELKFYSRSKSLFISFGMHVMFCSKCEVSVWQ